MPLSIQTKIDLTPAESAIFNDIQSFIIEQRILVVPRVAGGWVRDKLLGKQNNDIDIVLDTMTGHGFGSIYAKYSKLKKSKCIKIMANPEQSRHLETALICLEGLKIDLVQLRSETYTRTRIPTVVPGTPESDSYRRDLTVNALFYNLTTKTIEDFTGMGLIDLRNKILRTPLDPFATFSDDPLRMLRVIRFHTVLQFRISVPILAVLDNKELRSRLSRMVSSERVNTEMTKILSHVNFMDGLAVIFNYNLLNSILKLNEDDLSVKDWKDFELSVQKRDEYILLCSEHCNNQFLTNLLSLLIFYYKDSVSKIRVGIQNLKISRAQTKSLLSIQSNIQKIPDLALETELDWFRAVRQMGPSWFISTAIYLSINPHNEAVRKFLNSSCALGLHHVYNLIHRISIKTVRNKLEFEPRNTTIYIEKMIELDFFEPGLTFNQIIKKLRD